MITSTTILTAILFLAGAAEGGAAAPITFARGGQTVKAAVAGRTDAVVLAAFGRKWTKPAAVKDGLAKIPVPQVRVPTVFDIVSPNPPHKVHGSLIAYSDRGIGWDKSIRVYAAGAPAWFRQWAQAVGLAVAHTSPKEIRKIPTELSRGVEQRLLVLGQPGAGKAIASLSSLGRKQKLNLLVLEAQWLGAAQVHPPLAVTPRGMGGPLAGLRKQKWPRPPRFGQSVGSFPGICNRWSWIRAAGRPLVEEVALARRSQRRVVLSYLPWQRQLGRTEMADVLFVELLRTAAGPAKAPSLLDRQIRIINLELADASAAKADPSLRDKRALARAKLRPVLVAALSAKPAKTPNPDEEAVMDDAGGPVFVLDLRGKDPQPKDIGGTLARLSRETARKAPLLILGDDPILDGWKWLKLDRKKQTVAPGHVVWLSDDVLPADTIAKNRLMTELTRMKVSLWRARLETNHENQ